MVKVCAKDITRTYNSTFEVTRMVIDSLSLLEWPAMGGDNATIATGSYQSAPGSRPSGDQWYRASAARGLSVAGTEPE